MAHRKLAIFDVDEAPVRRIGLVRARPRMVLKNFAYRMRRLVPLERLIAAAPT